MAAVREPPRPRDTLAAARLLLQHLPLQFRFPSPPGHGRGTGTHYRRAGPRTRRGLAGEVSHLLDLVPGSGAPGPPSRLGTALPGTAEDKGRERALRRDTHCRSRQRGFIKHLKRIMTRCMDQVMERNYTLKCGDEKKDKGTRRIVIRPCQW
ncbi:dexamethasone-induced protein isoform X1 [Melopsittacus undulatus]|uniref:dexamethasone-induced protein isoform X1 n=1 Tax=Melopsittacus undulatus TaxID=13146 RepID=UPI00146CA478|nr:dexamethasone-induced protein isoform X1 [Melopsittacus undulatus]